MDFFAWLATGGLVLAAVPTLLFLANLRHYRRAPAVTTGLPSVSVLIPARNEAAGIECSVRAALASQFVDLEVVVLDDASTDATSEIVSRMAESNAQLRLEHAPALPAGWCGKQHACWVLAGLAKNDVLVFLDADVRLEPTGLSQAVGFLISSRAALVSGVPRQETQHFLEWLLIPLIHFVLLGFLPLGQMRVRRDPSLGAGCGQFFVTTKVAYAEVGGHAVIRTSLHDGVKLPRAYREKGLMTDLFDATPAAVCRMYKSSSEVWRGLSKNATEGLAAPRLIVPATCLLLGGQVLPGVLALGGVGGVWSPLAGWLGSAGWALGMVPRLVSVVWFRQSILGAVLHPVGIFVFLCVQWVALGSKLVGRPSQWKERSYAATN